jgi:hypothetical protein
MNTYGLPEDENDTKNGYSSSGYGSSGYESSGYESSGYDSKGYGSNGYESEGYGGTNVFGAGDSGWQEDLFSNGYQENVFEVNHADSPYTETAANPNPQFNNPSAEWGYKHEDFEL